MAILNSERNKRYRARHPERAREQSKVWQAKNPDNARTRALAYYHRNKDEINRKRREWRAKNPDKASERRKRYYAKRASDPKLREEDRKYLRLWLAKGRNGSRLQAKRRAAILKATPPWGQEGIEDVYKEAEYQQMHVDHIIPLQGDLVCGLHVVVNLQLLTPSENSRKKNKFDPETYSQEEMKCIATTPLSA